MQLQALLARVSPIAVAGPTNCLVERVVQDSRLASPGDLFVAIRGAHVDGHDFASRVDCAGVVAERAVDVAPDVALVVVSDTRIALAQLAAALAGDPSEELEVVGVTGTNGKTTTTWLLEGILTTAGKRVGVIGTTGHRIAGVESPARYTTPEAPAWQDLLRQMVDAECEVVAAEVSSIGLAARRVDATRFGVGVFTQFGRDHLDFHGDMESYLQAKLRLFSDLVASGGTVVIHAEDPVADRVRQAAGSRRLLEYGLQSGSVRAEEVQLSPRGTRFRLVTDRGNVGVEMALLGRHNVCNALAAAGAALALDLSPQDIAAGLAGVEGVPGRLEPVVHAGEELTVLVDYAHTPDALAAVLASARELCEGQLVLVFGCGGDRDQGKREDMARIACAGADRVYATSDNPRSESPEAILGDMASGLSPEAIVEVDRERAIALAVAEAGAGDLVLIAGKGHEQFQEVLGQRLPFDDRTVAAAALAERSKGGR